MPQFDLENARKAGYSDEEILGHLAESRHFDVEGARKAGYSDQEILSHLANTATTAPKPAAAPKPNTATETTTFQNILGASPADLFNRLKGAGRYIAKGAQGIKQYGEYLRGEPVSPTPLWMEPKIIFDQNGKPVQDPNEAVGEKAATIGVGTVLPAGGPRLSSQMIAGAATGAAMGSGNGSREEATAGMLLGAAAPVAVHGAIEGAKKIAQFELPAIVKTGAQAVERGESPLKAIADRPREPVKAMTQALKPLSTNIEFSQNVERALPHLKAAEAELGRPIAGVQDLRDATTLAKKQLWKEYEALAGPQASKGVDASPVADAIEKSIPLKLKVQNPAAVEKIQELANTYRRAFTLGELDDMLSTSNAELASYYGKYPAARTIAERGNPEIAQNVAEAKALRDLIYKQLDQGGAAREIKRDYGALMNIEKESQRRLNVAARQNPESLSEQLSRWQAAMHVGKAAVTFPARPVGAAGDLASAYFGRRMATELKQANSADALIANVFRNYQGAPPVRPTFVPPPAPVPPPVKGMLNPAPTTATRQFSGTASSDTSFVKGVPAQPAVHTGLPNKLPYKTFGQAIKEAGAQQTTKEIINARLQQFRDLVESGATEMTGKGLRDELGTVIRRGGGGMKKMFPELAAIPEDPAVIVAAIKKGSGPLYERIFKAVRDNLPETAESLGNYIHEFP